MLLCSSAQWNAIPAETSAALEKVVSGIMPSRAEGFL